MHKNRQLLKKWIPPIEKGEVKGIFKTGNYQEKSFPCYESNINLYTIAKMIVEKNLSINSNGIIFWNGRKCTPRTSEKKKT